MGKETNIMQAIRVAVSKLGTRIFRTNVGRAWTGNKIINLPKNHAKWPGAIVIVDPRPFSTGLPKGYSDLSGWTPVVVTDDMVGKTVAVFTAIEVKAPTGSKRKDQENFISAVQNAGGIAGFARSVKEAEQIVRVN